MLVLSLPAIYTLELTSACNNRCPGCSNIYAAHRVDAPLPASTWETWLADIGPTAERIRLSGGEPTLHPEFMRILDAATSYEAYVTVFSNGRWADPVGLVRQLQNRPRFLGLLISLHGAQAATHDAFSGVQGSFAETLHNICLALDHGITVALSTVVTRLNAHELPELVALGQALGVQHMAFNRYVGAPQPAWELSNAELQRVTQQIDGWIAQGVPLEYGVCVPQCLCLNQSHGCLAGAAYVSIDPWGNVHPCHHSPTIIGSLQDASLATWWHHPRMHAWRNLMPRACATCAALSLCHGGCRAAQELRPDQRDPLRQQPLRAFHGPTNERVVAVDLRPRAAGRLRPEPFGFALLGRGQVIPVRAEAEQVITACDGTRTFGELADLFGQAGLDLLGELWSLGLLEAT